jgi:hypothetical protein
MSREQGQEMAKKECEQGQEMARKELIDAYLLAHLC